MRIYMAAAVLTATYALIKGLMSSPDPVSLIYSTVAGALVSIALILSTVPLAGPLIYNVAVDLVLGAARFQADSLFLAIMWAASWAVNLTFTAALSLYLMQVRRAVARRVIRELLL